MPSLFLFYNHNPERKDKAVEERRGHRAKSYADDATAIGLRPSPSGGTLRRSNDDGHKEEQDLSPNNVVASAPCALTLNHLDLNAFPSRQHHELLNRLHTACTASC
jgi:hypothetical protein